MKWINHLAIAGATTAVISPALVPVALLGSTAPDWLEWVLKALTGQDVKHRGVTHYVISWVLGLAFALLLWDFHGLLAAFAWGGLTHVLADSMTVSGVPFAPHSERRFHLFGGRLRTGETGEYAIAWGIVAVCAVGMQLTQTQNGWYPFFYDWAGLYEQGLVDAKEWKDNRFRFF
jgi:inner membrane protein